MTPTVLVVDDNATTRRLVRFVLEPQGVSVVDVATAAAALTWVAECRPDLILQDLRLDDMDGFELLGHLRKLCPGAPILALTGFLAPSDDGVHEFDDVVVKPISPPALTSLVAAYLAPAAARPATRRVRIVLADDDPVQLRLGQYRLSQAGFDVRIASDGVRALAEIRRGCDAIVSDVLMPGLDGFQLALAIRQDPALARLPVVLVTNSYVDASDRALAIRAGASAYVVRTPEFGAAIEALHGCLSGTIPSVPPTTVRPEEMERDHASRLIRQVERLSSNNAALARRATLLASELTILAGLSTALIAHGDVRDAVYEALATCFDAGGLTAGALLLLGPDEEASWRPIGETPTDPERYRPAVAHFRHTDPERWAETYERGAGSPFEPLLDDMRAGFAHVVPLAHPGGVRGAIVSFSSRRIDADERALLRAMANQVTHVVTLGRAHEARLASEARWRALVDHAPDIVAQIDTGGVVRFVNKADLSHAVGRAWDALLPQECHAVVREALGRAAAGESASCAITLDTPSGRRWFAVRMGLIREGMHSLGTVVIARDVTGEKDTEAQLMQADRLASVGVLAASVAHEINNPLAATALNLEYVTELVIGAPATREVRGLLEALRDAQESTERVRQIVLDLRLFSHSSDNKAVPLDVRTVLDSALRIAHHELRNRARVIQRYETVPRVLANEGRLGQVFLNLLVNAAQAIPAGQMGANSVTVTVGSSDGCVRVAIADTGAGIPPEVQRRIFDPFFTTKPKGVGTGLGLSICARIVESLGGRIAFTSQPGRGTEFEVLLPAHAADPAAIPAVAPPPPSSPRRRVLIIDDEVTLGAALANLLGREHDVTFASTAQEALAALATGSYDVLLCDVMMPGTTAEAMTEAIAAHDPRLRSRIIYATGGAYTPESQAFLSSVPNLRVMKPFDLAALRALFAQVG